MLQLESRRLKLTEDFVEFDVYSDLDNFLELAREKRGGSISHGTFIPKRMRSVGDAGLQFATPEEAKKGFDELTEFKENSPTY